MIPISVCIITKNEEKNIEKCLAPISGYGFEIVVVDTGSTDKTKEIAAKYTDKIYDFEWINDFSAARNYSIKKASHNYILVLDCDEFVTDIDVEGIYKAIEEHPKAVGMMLRNNDVHQGDKQGNFPERVERLFHRNYYYYKYSIHEQVTEIRTDNTIYERYDLPLAARHIGYVGTPDEKQLKVDRNNALLFKEIEKDPENAYLYFQVGQSYNLICDYENAYKYYKKAFECPLITNQIWVELMASAYLNCMNFIGKSHEAIAFFEPYYDTFATNANFYNNMGLAYLHDDQPLKAMLEFVKATNCPVAYEEGANTYLPLYNIGVINELMGNTKDAISFYQRCGDYPLALDRLRNLTK